MAYLRWYVGEVSTAVYVVNIPACWPLLRKVFKLDNWSKNRTVTSFSTIDPYSRQSTVHDKRILSVFSTTDEKSKASESEVHLAEFSSSQWNSNDEPIPVWPLSVHQAGVIAGSVDDREVDVRDDGIVRTVEISQKRVMRPDDPRRGSSY